MRVRWEVQTKGINLLINLNTLSFAHWLRNCHLEGSAERWKALSQFYWNISGWQRTQDARTWKKSCNSDDLVSPFFSAKPNSACYRYLTIRETLELLCWIAQLAERPQGLHISYILMLWWLRPTASTESTPYRQHSPWEVAGKWGRQFQVTESTTRLSSSSPQYLGSM